MNLLQKQGFYNSLILYAGTALGFFNLIILFQRYLTIEEIGFYQLLITISTLYAQIASLGISNIVLRYFPYFRTDDKKHNGFVSFVCLFALVSFAVFTLLFILLKSSIIQQYQGREGGELLVRYYYYLIPLSFFTIAYLVIESLARAVFKNVLSAFLKEVLLRILTSVSVLLIAAQIADYHNFVVIYVLSNFVVCVVLALSLYRGKYFQYTTISADVKKSRREMVNYGFFAVLSGSSFALIQNMDTLMLSTMTHESLAYVGIYGTFFGIAVVVSLPAKALNRTSYQIISDAWKDNDMAKISRIYHKTSVVQSLVGFLLLIGLIVNKHNILFLLHKPEYQNFFNVFIIVGLGFVVDITGGLNSHIINSSKYYKTVTVFQTLSVIGVIVFNYFLIPLMGMLGAAIAYLLTTFLLNFGYWLFIKIKFSMQPFDKSHLLIFIISAVAFLVGWKLPVVDNFFIDVIYRSVTVGAIYGALAYFLKVSVDINEAINKVLIRRS